MRYSILIILMFLFASPRSYSQSGKFFIKGYLKDMQTVMHSPDIGFFSDNLIHNRIDGEWSIFENLKINGSLRNRIMWGDFTRMNITDYNKDNGFIDLSWQIFNEPGMIGVSNMDRIYVDYTWGKFQATLGRQRINWGTSLIWNPNDIFNTFNFFDFDYEERPGTDALRVQYYTGFASSAEVVYQPANDFTDYRAAALFKSNLNSADYQVMAGKDYEDLVLGGGITTTFLNLLWRGEVSLFSSWEKPFEKPDFVGTLSAEYYFSNGLFLNGGFLYNSAAANTGGSIADLLGNKTLSVKTLSWTKWTWFTQLYYPLNPLISGGISVMYYPESAWFVGPNISYSISDYVSVSAFAQIFGLNEKIPVYGKNINMAFLRLKFSF